MTKRKKFKQLQRATLIKNRMKKGDKKNTPWGDFINTYTDCDHDYKTKEKGVEPYQ